MKSILRGHGLILSASLLVALAGCGGGGNTPGAATATTHAPVATAPTWTPAGTSLSEYSVYTFSTTATDPDFGVGIASYQWTFGDGSATVSTTVPTVTYSYANAGSYTLQVAATNTAGVQGAAAGETVTVVAAPNPFTVTPTSPSAATTLQVASGSTAGVQITFAFNVTDSDGGTIVPAGVTLNPGDANAVVGTPVAGASGAWTVPVTYGAGTTTGSRTANPTVQVADSLGIGSLVTAFPVITVNTAVQNTATTPSITLTAPTAATTNAFSSVQQTLAFTLTDLNGNPLNYTVNWGDGTPPTSALISDPNVIDLPEKW